MHCTATVSYLGKKKRDKFMENVSCLVWNVRSLTQAMEIRSVSKTPWLPWCLHVVHPSSTMALSRDWMVTKPTSWSNSAANILQQHLLRWMIVKFWKLWAADFPRKAALQKEGTPDKGGKAALQFGKLTDWCLMFVQLHTGTGQAYVRESLWQSRQMLIATYVTVFH